MNDRNIPAIGATPGARLDRGGLHYGVAAGDDRHFCPRALHRGPRDGARPGRRAALVGTAPPAQPRFCSSCGARRWSGPSGSGPACWRCARGARPPVKPLLAASFIVIAVSTFPPPAGTTDTQSYAIDGNMVY